MSVARGNSVRAQAVPSTPEEEADLARRVRRSRLLTELLESEARYAAVLKGFGAVAEQCLARAELVPFGGVGSGGGSSSGGGGGGSSSGGGGGGSNSNSRNVAGSSHAGGDDSLRWPELWCLRANLEQIASLSEVSTACLGRALRETGGDRVGRAMERIGGLLALYESYAALFSLSRGAVERLSADDVFASEWRRVAQQQQRRGAAGVRVRPCYSVELEPLAGEDDAQALPAVQPPLPTTLSAYLIMPVQRLPRYELLLEQIIDESRGAGEAESAWLAEETEILAKVLAAVKRATERMDQAAHAECPLALLPDSLLAQLASGSERAAPSGSGPRGPLDRLICSEQEHLRQLCRLELFYAAPLLRAAYGSGAGSGAESPPSTGARSRRRSLFASPPGSADAKEQGAKRSSLPRRLTGPPTPPIAESPTPPPSPPPPGPHGPLSAQGALLCWLAELPAGDARALGEVVRNSGLVVLLLAVSQEALVSQHVLAELQRARAAGDDSGTLVDALLWVGCLLRLSRGFCSASLGCRHVAPQPAVLLPFSLAGKDEAAQLQLPALAGWDETALLGLQGPPWFQRRAEIVRRLLAQPRGGSGLARLDELARLCRAHGLDACAALRAPLERPAALLSELAAVVMHPGDVLAARRADLSGALASALRAQRFVERTLDARLLTLALARLDALRAAREPLRLVTPPPEPGEPGDEEGQQQQQRQQPGGDGLIRCGVLLIKRRAHLVWLLGSEIVLGAVKSMSAAASPLAVSRLHSVPLECTDSARASTALTISLSSELELKVPDDGTECWTVPQEDLGEPRPSAIYAAWVKDITEAKMRLHERARGSSKA